MPESDVAYQDNRRSGAHWAGPTGDNEGMAEGNVDGEALFSMGSETLAPYSSADPRAFANAPEHRTAGGVSRAVSWRGKRVLDVVGAALLGLLFAPLIVVIICVLKQTGGAVLFRHRRVGLHGQTFECLKFRTMVPDADPALANILDQNPQLKEEWLRGHKLKEDPRVTKIGRLLRRTSLDELPQLWNVFIGDMSLVGPRPVVREELIRYGRMAAVYTSTLPGLTGLWQVSGRDAIEYRRRVAMDVYYVRNSDALMDLYILCRTAGVVLSARGS